jgi:hypothetical protein
MSDDHYTVDELQTYRRSAAAPDLAESLGRHLEVCPVCRKLWESLADSTEGGCSERSALPGGELGPGREQRSEPSDQPGGLIAGTARLVFDSFHRPLPGVRGCARIDRHLLFAQGDLLLEMHLEPGQEQDHQSITGQLQSVARGSPRFEGVPVMLVEGQRVLRSTRTNASGEFVFCAAPRRALALWLLCREGPMKVPCLLP